MADETYTVALDTTQFQAGAQQGAQAAEKLEAQTRRIDAAARAAANTMGRAKADIYDFADAYEVVNAEIAATPQALFRTAQETRQYFSQMISDADRAAEATAKMGGDGGGGKGGGKDGGGVGLGMGILYASQAIEDMQYGIGAVLNNIPMLIGALGGSGGLAGVVSIVAVGATQLINHWDDLASLWGGGHTETEAERMERLAKATERTAAEEKELAIHTERTNALQKIRATPGGFTAGQSQALGEQVGDLGGAAAQDMVRRAIIERERRANAGMPWLVEARSKTAAGDAATLLQRAQSGDAAQRQSAQESLRGLLDQPGFRDTNIARSLGVIPDKGNPEKGRARQQADEEALEAAEAEAAAARRKQAQEEDQRIRADLIARQGERIAREHWDSMKLSSEAFLREAKVMEEIGEFELAELLKKKAAAKDREAQEDRDRQRRKTEEQIQSAGGEGGVLGSLAERIVQLRASRATGGRGLDEGEAYDTARKEAFAYARRSRMMGGLGLNEENAQRFATEAVLKAAPQSREMFEQFSMQNPQTREQMRQAMAAQMGVAYRPRGKRMTRADLRRAGKRERAVRTKPQDAAAQARRKVAEEMIRRQRAASLGRSAAAAGAITEQDIRESARSAMFKGALQAPGLIGALGGVAAGGGAQESIGSIVEGLRANAAATKSLDGKITELMRKGVTLEV